MRTECTAASTCVKLGLAAPPDLQSPRCLVGLHKNLTAEVPLDFLWLFVEETGS